MKPIVIVVLLNGILSLSAYAQYLGFNQYVDMPYSTVRASLVSEGWQPIPNQQIQETSFYAQGIFDQGYKEVVNCISMERDQCQFVLQKNKQFILITTKEKTLNVESIEAK